APSARAFRYRNHDLGWGALSSTIMKLRDPDCDSAKAKTLLQRFATAAIRSYLGVQAFLRARGPFDCAYIFNGRFACTRGALRACEEQGISDIRLHERGSSIRTYELYRGCLPHDRGWWQRNIDAAWIAAADNPARREVGSMYFELRRKGSPADWKSFTRDQDIQRLPPDWDNTKTNIGIFTSSEDEFAGIGDEWRNPVYESQTAGIEWIVADARAQYPDVHLYVRVHPNLKGVVNGDVERLRRMKGRNLTLIEPESTISTYALLDRVDKAVTFGSTVGVEATFWGKVSILAGHSLYEHLDVVHVAHSHDELMQMLGARLSPKHVDGAIKYGFYMHTFGIPFKYWRASSFTEGVFNGKSLSWMPTTALERRILLRCLEAGVHNAL